MTMNRETSRNTESRRALRRRTPRLLTMKRAQAGASLVVATTLSMAGVLAFASPSSAAPVVPTLGAASNFAVLAHAGVGRLAGATVVGDVGLLGEGSTTTTPLPTVAAGLLGVGTGALDVANGPATTALGAASTAYRTAQGDTPTTVIAGAELQGGTLTPGVYSVVGPLSLGGVLRLDALGHANAGFIFQIPSTLTTAPGSSVVLEGGAQARNVLWQVGQSASLAHGSSFVGSLLAEHAVTLGAGTDLVGRAVSLLAGVNLGASSISLPTIPTSSAGAAAIPSAGTAASTAGGLTSSLVPIIGGLVPTVSSLVPTGLVGTLAKSATGAVKSVKGLVPRASTTAPTSAVATASKPATKAASLATGLLGALGSLPSGIVGNPTASATGPVSSTTSSGLIPSVGALVGSVVAPAATALAPALSAAVPTSGHGSLVHGDVAPGAAPKSGATVNPHASTATTTTVPTSASGTIPSGAPATGQGGMAGSGFTMFGLLGLAAMALAFIAASVARTRRRRLA